MLTHTKLTLKMIALLLGAMYFSGCTGGAASSSFGSAGSSATGLLQPPDGQSDGVTDPNFMYVGVDATNNTVAHVHQDGKFSTSCSIDPKTTLPLQDIKCIVDIPEGELYNH